MDFLNVELTLIDIVAEELFTIGNISITNAMLTTLLVSFLFVVMSLNLGKYTTGIKNPTKVQLLGELIVEQILNFIESITRSKKIALSILGIIGTLFVYITVANLITVFIPFLTFIEYREVSLFRTPSSDLNFTVGLAISMLILVQILSIQKFTLWKHLNKYVRIGTVVSGFRQGIGTGFTAIISFFVGILDIVSEFAKIISLSLRLFGNVFAGEVLVAVVMSLISFLVPIPLILLGILSGVIQAVVFGALITSYVTLAMEE